MKNLLLLIVTLFSIALETQATPTFIINEDLAGESFSSEVLKKVFLAKTKKWSNGSSILLAMPKTGEARDGVIKDVFGKSTNQFKAYWKKLLFSGKAAPPKEFKSDPEIVEYVRTHPGAIGFVTTEVDTDGLVEVEW